MPNVVFGSEIAAEFITTKVAAVTALTSVVGDRLYPLDVLPADVAPPAVLYYMETPGQYEGVIGSGIPAERMSFVVRVICEGWSTDPIRVAAEALFNALNGAEGTHGSFYVSLLATGEWSRTATIENGLPYRQLGNYYQVDVTSGG